MGLFIPFWGGVLKTQPLEEGFSEGRDTVASRRHRILKTGLLWTRKTTVKNPQMNSTGRCRPSLSNVASILFVRAVWGNSLGTVVLRDTDDPSSKGELAHLVSHSSVCVCVGGAARH